MGILNLLGKGKNKNKAFKFSDPEDKPVFTCNHIIDDKAPILYVEHDTEEDWQFLCGNNNHTEENAKIISLKQIVTIDPTLNDMFEMPIGFGAERKEVGATWKPFKL